MDQTDIMQRELEEQTRRDMESQRPDTPGVRDEEWSSGLHERYDHPDADEIPQDVAEYDEEPPNDRIEMNPAGKASADPEETLPYELPDQEEINELTAGVTSFGLDDEVLGRDGLMEAIRSAEDAEAKGGSYAEAFSSAAERMISGKQDSEPMETDQAGIPNLQPDTRELAHDRYIEHKNKLEASYENGGGWHRDTIDTYHRMGMTYNAYLSGEKMDGLPVTKADVFLSGIRFYQSNIFETMIIRAVKFACGVIQDNREDKVEVGQNLSGKGMEKESPLKDDLGAFDHGDATGVAREDVSAVRADIPEYGMNLGIDTSRGQSYNSTENVQIFQPTDYIAKLDTGNGKTFNIPGMRLVEVDGAKALVGPDGKVAFESVRAGVDAGLNAGGRARVEIRCDAFEFRNVREPFAELAQSRGVSVDTLKSQYANRAKEMYAARIENNMAAEANRLESRTLPEAREELRSFQADYNRLDKLETALSRGGSLAEDMAPDDIQNLKAELHIGMDVLQDRISAMEERVGLLRDVHAQIGGSTVEDRFTRAAMTEDNAVGRAGRIEYISNDADKKIMDMADRGADKIIADVEKFNAANPESAVSYDRDSGELYNRYGISESGKYNERYAAADKSELPSDHPDAISEHISKYGDADFDKWREFDGDQPEQRDVEKPEQDAESPPPDAPPDVEQAPPPETDAPLPEEQPVESAQTKTAPETGLPSEVADAMDTAAPEQPTVTSDSDAVEPEDPFDPDIGNPANDDASDPAAADRKAEPDNEEQAEAQVAAAQDDDPETALEMPEEPNASATVGGDEADVGEPEIIEDVLDKVKEILAGYFSDTDGMTSPEVDVVQPVSDLLREAGIEDYSHVFDSISEIMAGQANAMDNISRLTDLVEGFIEASPVPADAFDTFSNAMLEAGIPQDISDAVMDDMLSLDHLTEPFDLDVIGLTIGGQELTIDPDGIFDAVTGEPAGGFIDDQPADRFFEQADQSLYEQGADVEIPGYRMETGSAEPTESLQPDLEMIGVPDDVASGDETLDVGAPEAPADIPGAIEGVEAAEGAGLAEGVEAATAAFL